MVEEIFRPGEEVVGVESPAAQGNSDAKLMFFVALAMKRDETQVLAGGELQQRS